MYIDTIIYLLYFFLEKYRINPVETLAINIVLILLGVFMALPLVYAISSSLKPLDEIWMFPPRFFVINPTPFTEFLFRFFHAVIVFVEFEFVLDR